MTESGRQCVIMAGAEKRHRLFVGSWDTQMRQTVIIILCKSIELKLSTICLVAFLSIAIHVRRGCTAQGTGGILQVRWLCTGEESRLLNCSAQVIAECDHKRDAGVYCSG